ncbi:MAG: hypothetical protein ACRDTE_16995 [Pseudonocardiaceae bacterium]
MSSRGAGAEQDAAYDNRPSRDLLTASTARSPAQPGRSRAAEGFHHAHRLATTHTL